MVDRIVIVIVISQDVYVVPVLTRKLCCKHTHSRVYSTFYTLNLLVFARVFSWVTSLDVGSHAHLLCLYYPLLLFDKGPVCDDAIN